MKVNYKILAIDTSCDETSVAITEDNKILTNIISSQIEYHQEYGGVVPFLAKRMHQKLIEPTINSALKQTGLQLNGKCINAIAVTIGPGLAPALEEGIKKAKELSINLNLPLIAVNHMEAHLLSPFAKNSKNKGPIANPCTILPLLSLLISGGHTQLVLMHDFGKYELLGETVDDAAGEAFDKVAKMLKLGYPGGPIITELAKKGLPKYKLPIPMRTHPSLNFSFSGLKTACLYKLKELKPKYDKKFLQDFSASFELAVIKSLTIKLEKAIRKYQPKSIGLGGGVISNLHIRNAVRNTAKKYNLRVYIPYSQKLFTDNAAMVGICAWRQAQRQDFVKNIDHLDRRPSLNF